MGETTEITNEILEILGIDSDYRTDSLELLEKGESRYLRDLKLNLSSTLTSEHLSTKECALIGLSSAVNNNNKLLTQYFTRYAEEQGATSAETAEAAGCASLLASNNVFYRFRHFTQKEKYSQIPARIRMQFNAKIVIVGNNKTGGLPIISVSGDTPPVDQLSRKSSAKKRPGNSGQANASTEDLGVDIGNGDVALFTERTGAAAKPDGSKSVAVKSGEKKKETRTKERRPPSDRSAHNATPEQVR